jgi:hypothetical protein
MKIHFSFLILLFIISSVISCAAIGSIFKAGIWAGVTVIVIIGISIYLAFRGSNKVE